MNLTEYYANKKDILSQVRPNLTPSPLTLSMIMDVPYIKIESHIIPQIFLPYVVDEYISIDPEEANYGTFWEKLKTRKLLAVFFSPETTYFVFVMANYKALMVRGRVLTNRCENWGDPKDARWIMYKLIDLFEKHKIQEIEDKREIKDNIIQNRFEILDI
jgi:hypothetical protein